MTCPICHKPVQPADPYMPFCSDRCRILDLGNWASEKYVVPAAVDPEDDVENDVIDHDAAEDL
jgi:endogenous inhibitor of DNA gyrase (YacG/DUF329 family)